MFNRNLIKRIEELEDKMDLQENRPSVNRDFFTKNVHYVSDMVCISGSLEVTYPVLLGFGGWGSQWIGKDFYFLKGTEPKCDSINEYENGKIEYIRKNVKCDKNGKIK